MSYESIMGSGLFMQDLLNYVLETYNAVVKCSVEGLEVRHNREAETIGKASKMTPVEEASIIVADIGDGPFVGFEENFKALTDNQMYSDIVSNLLISHSNRWGVPGYKCDAILINNIRPYGLFGSSTIGVRNHLSSPFIEELLEDDYTVSITSYNDDDTAVNNYLYVNRIPGGMAIIAKDGVVNYLFSIIPKGVFTVNTINTSVPAYITGCAADVPIYSIERSMAKLHEISSIIGVRPILHLSSSHIGSIVIQQSYQRIVGARGNIEDEDVFLASVSEMARGGWSVGIGNKVLALFAAWFCKEGDLVKPDLIRAYEYVRDAKGTDQMKMEVNNSCAAVWTWLAMQSIQPGPNIDTNRIARITSYYGRFPSIGGTPTSFHSSVPRSIEAMKLSRGHYTIQQFITSSPNLIFIPPPEAVNEAIIQGGAFDYNEYDEEDF
jgi:hypothetical protein